MAPYQTNKPGISSLETASLDDASPQVNKGMEMMMLGLDRDSLVKTLGTEVGLRDWGYPGFLTELEFSIFEQFRDEVFSNRRDDSFRSTVFSFEKANEEVAYALCRWLRARKYNLQDTITMVEEATECTAEPRKHDFYPCPTTALSVESSLYIKQYPQLYYGHARNGCPVFISQPGMINIDAISSLTCIPKIVNYHWYAMMHEFTGKLKEEKTTSHGAFKRYECMCILDLNGLTATKIGKRELNLTKVQAAIDSLCFPETLNRMVIVNAPGYFTFTWKIIKGWIDQRTSAKVEVIGTNKEKLLKKLSALIDPTKLPSDYGGSGISINDFLNNDMRRMAESRRQIGSELKLVEEDTNLVSFSSSVSKSIAVNSGQFVKICFLTRSIVGCNIIVKESNSDKIMARINVVHSGSSEDDENETPSRFDLEDSGMVLHENTSYDVNFVSNGSERKIINVMMVTKSFVVEDLVKVSNVEATEEKKAPITRSTDTKFCGSICTGVFSPENNNVVTVVSSSDMRLHNNSS